MELISVTSRANETLRFARALQEKKHRDRSRRFFTEGLTLFREALAAGLVPETVVLSDKLDAKTQKRILEALAQTDARVLRVPEDLSRSISPEHAPQGVFAIFAFLEDTENSKFVHKKDKKSIARYIILEKIQDPGNAGSMLRSAAAFGYTGAFLCGAADLYHPKTMRGAMGALFSLELAVFESVSDLLSECDRRSLTLYGTSPHAPQTIGATRFAAPFAVCFGNEGAGMSEELTRACDEVFSIPMRGAESLNAAAACAVVLYETQRGNEL